MLKRLKKAVSVIFSNTPSEGDLVSTNNGHLYKRKNVSNTELVIPVEESFKEILSLAKDDPLNWTLERVEDSKGSKDTHVHATHITGIIVCSLEGQISFGNGWSKPIKELKDIVQTIMQNAALAKAKKYLQDKSNTWTIE